MYSRANPNNQKLWIDRIRRLNKRFLIINKPAWYIFENGSRFWSNIEHDLGKTNVYAELEWYSGWIQQYSVTVIQSMFVRGKNKILMCGADLCPIPINDSSDASENPDLQNDVSKIPCTPRYFIFSFFWTFALACFVLTIRSTKHTSVQEDQSRNGYTSLAFMLSDFNKVSKCKLFNFKIMIVNNRCVEHKVVLFN